MLRIRDLTTGKTVGICSTEFQAAQMACDTNVTNYVAENVQPQAFQFFTPSMEIGASLVFDNFTVEFNENGEPEFTCREGEVADDQGHPQG
jgi:hypothetical protein